MPRLARQAFRFTAYASAILCLALTAAWISARFWQTAPQVEVGRGRFVIAWSSDADTQSLTLERYDRPLASYHPSATFLRTAGYGWFVDNLRGWESESIWAAGFRASRDDCDYENSTKLFMTRWHGTVPQWFALLTFAFPSAFLVFRPRFIGWRSAGRAAHESE